MSAGGAAPLVDDLLARPTTTQTDWAWPAELPHDHPDAWSNRNTWLTRLFELWARGPSQLQERVSWILAGLLVVGTNDAVQYPDIKEHHNRLRAWPNAASYRALLEDVANTGPMQKYLTGVFSEAPHPNENLARELMELFSLGVTHPKTGADNYLESDVKEIARALTGYRMDWNTGAVFYDAAYWDTGTKTFLGAGRGAAKLPSVMNAIVAHDSFKYFVPKRFYRELVGVDPSAAALDEMATAWGTTGDLGSLVAHIARRPEFLADATIGNRVKSPVELFVSSLKVLEIDDIARWSIAWTSFLLRQNPFAPPDVSGWGNRWLHPSHLVLWSTFSYWYCWQDRGPAYDATPDATPPERRSKTIRRLFAEATRATAADAALKLAGLHDVSAQTRNAVDAYARASGWTNEPWSFERASGVMQMVLNSPEFLVS